MISRSSKGFGGGRFQAQAVKESRDNLGEGNGFFGLKMEDVIQIL
jgi:hypothetical protein